MFTDQSKTSEGRGSGVFITELDYREDCSVFQIGHVAIRYTCDLPPMSVFQRRIEEYVAREIFKLF